MTNRSLTVAFAVVALLSSASASFAAAAGANGGAPGGGSAGASGNGGPPIRSLVAEFGHKTHPNRLENFRCGLGPMQNGFYGAEIAIFEQICANEL
jgi:hypothetical protein